MTISKSLLFLAHSLAGCFENHQQALQNPAWFVHLKLWQYPVAVFGDRLGLFIEQVSVASGNPPYRQRLIELYEQQGAIWAQYYGLRSPQAFCGGATEPDRLKQLTPDDLIYLPTCKLKVTPPKTSLQNLPLVMDRIGTSQKTVDSKAVGSETIGPRTIDPQTVSFQAEMQPGQLGSFEYQGQTRYLRLKFELKHRFTPAQTIFYMEDQGIEPETNKVLWGPRMGPFELVKQADFSHQYHLTQSPD
ncbi:MAG: chromophore lyase CpcT/CpeT [Cyanobacteria bacterium P01_C01_bin.73]